MAKFGQNSNMSTIKSITKVGFNPPSDARLPVEVLSIADLRTRAPKDHFDRLQRADFYRLIGVLSGGTRPMVDFSHFDLRAADWLLVRPGQVFRYDFSRPWSGWLMVFRADSLPGASTDRMPEGVEWLRRVDDLVCQHRLLAENHRCMQRIAQQMQRDCEPSSDKELRHVVLRLELMGALLRLSGWQDSRATVVGPAMGSDERYRRFRHLLEREFAAHHQVQHYARALGTSEKTLGRICLAATGEPAKAIINHRLVLEAKRLLAHTTQPVQNIAGDLGFAEATHFVKFFKKMAGVTPLEFRRAVPS